VQALAALRVDESSLLGWAPKAASLPSNWGWVHSMPASPMAPLVPLGPFAYPLLHVDGFLVPTFVHFPMVWLAGGYVGYAMTTRWGGADAGKLQMIGFDMGGTSTGGGWALGVAGGHLDARWMGGWRVVGEGWAAAGGGTAGCTTPVACTT